MKWKIYRRKTSYWRKCQWVDVQENFRRPIDRKRYSKAKWELVNSYKTEKAFQEAWKTLQKRRQDRFNCDSNRYYNYKFEVEQ